MSVAPAWRVRDTLTAAALFLFSAAFTLYQNARVAVLWDLSYLLDTSFRISLHQLPYREYPLAHAPLTFLLHAAIIRIFGRVYLPHILCAALESGLATLLTWRILLRLLKPLANRAFLIATLLAVPLVFLGIYGIYPHPIYDSDCILAVLLALYLLQRASQSAPRNLLAGVSCVLPLFFKQNIGLPFLLTTLAAVATLALARCLQRAGLAPQLWLLTGAITAFAAAALLIHATVGLHNYFTWTILFAAQRRLPGIPLILDIYRQTSLLWTLPAALIAFALLRRDNRVPHPSQPHRDGWEVKLRVPHPFRVLCGMGGSEIAGSGNSASPPRSSSARSIAALLLLAAPFLWTIASLALTSDPDDRAGQLLSLWPHLLVLAAALALDNLRPSLLVPPTSPCSYLSSSSQPSTAHSSPSSSGGPPTPSGRSSRFSSLRFSRKSPPSPARSPSSSPPLSSSAAASTPPATSASATSISMALSPAPPSPNSAASPPPAPGFPALNSSSASPTPRFPPPTQSSSSPATRPFYFATGRTPQFPVLLFDPATDPYSPQQVLDQSRAHNVRWLIVSRNLQLTGPPSPDLPDILRALQPGFTLVRSLPNFDLYRRK